MKTPFAVRLAPLTLIWLLSPCLICGQTVAQPATAISPADAAWQSLTALRIAATSSVSTNAVSGISPAPPAPSTLVSANAGANAASVGTSANVKVVAEQAATRSRQAAEAAKNFYTTYPTHANAPEARKIEALGELRGIKHGDAVHETKAMTLAAAFRADLRHPQPARVEVAFAMDRAELSRRVKTKEKTGRVQERIRVGDRLRAEFGEIPEYHAYSMEVARTADLPTALRLATETSVARSASPESKAQAKVILERTALLGKTVNLKLDALDGPDVDLAKPNGKITVLVAWSPSVDPKKLDPLKPLARMLPSGAQVVFLALGGTEKQVKSAKSAMPLPGTLCLAPAGPRSRAASDALKLQYAPLPRLYVFNSAGKLAGFGPLEDLPALLARAAK